MNRKEKRLCGLVLIVNLTVGAAFTQRAKLGDLFGSEPEPAVAAEQTPTSEESPRARD